MWYITLSPFHHSLPFNLSEGQSKLSYIINEQSHVDLLSASHGSFLDIHGSVSPRILPHILALPCMSFVKLSLNAFVFVGPATLRVVVLTYACKWKKKAAKVTTDSFLRIMDCVCGLAFGHTIAWLRSHRGHPSCGPPGKRCIQFVSSARATYGNAPTPRAMASTRNALTTRLVFEELRNGKSSCSHLKYWDSIFTHPLTFSIIFNVIMNHLLKRYSAKQSD